MIHPVVQGLKQYGYPGSLALDVGIVELIGVLAYGYRRTAVLGAIFLTGFLGGAFAVNLRLAYPFARTLGPVYFGVLI